MPKDELSHELSDLLTLHLVPGLGPRLTAALLDHFGSAGAILQAATEQLCEVPHIGGKLARDLHQAMREADVAGELEKIAEHEVRLYALGGAGYPESLTHIADPPHLLYVRGSLEERDATGVAVVGSRQCTAYGRRIAERLAVDLAQRGVTVISGLARGIDAAAHRGALKAGGRTLAVLAGGLSKIYPPEHSELAREVHASGALISEASMMMQPMAAMFPARNRLISGLARGVVIVEAAERSGALITARHAAEQGKTVFAVPGSVDSPASAGALRLLRDGAILVRGVEDIFEELDGVASVAAAARSEPPGLTDTERRIWELLAEQPRHVDEIAIHLGQAVHQVTSALTMLEMKKVLRRLPGSLYERRE